MKNEKGYTLRYTNSEITSNKRNKIGKYRRDYKNPQEDKTKKITKRKIKENKPEIHSNNHSVECSSSLNKMQLEFD